MLQSVLDTMFRGASGDANRQVRGDNASSVSAAGKSGNKAKKQAKKLCQNQVAQCQAALTDLCADDPVCLEGLPCCDLFATCDTTGALVCIFPDA